MDVRLFGLQPLQGAYADLALIFDILSPVVVVVVVVFTLLPPKGLHYAKILQVARVQP